VAPGGRTLFNQSVMVRSFVRIDYFAKGPNGESVRRIVNPYAFVWGAYPNLSLSFVAPLVSVRRDGPAMPSSVTKTDFGDGRVFARYDLFRKNVPGGFTRLSPEVGIQIPTGTAFSTGSAAPIASLVFSHVRDPHWLVADVQFTYSTTNSDGFRPGNRWRYDVTYMRRLADIEAPTIYLVLEMNGEQARRSRLNGGAVEASGGNLVFLSPGVEMFLTRRLVLEFSLPVPAGRDLNGNQLKPRVSVIGGFRWLF